jgi:hypothetical protein
MAHDNNLIGGETGSGKTNLAQHIASMSGSDCIVWFGKETRAGAMNMAKWALQNGRQFIFDDLDDQERVFPLAVLPKTDDPAEQELNAESLLEALMRRRGSANADANPLIETITECWSKIVMELDLSIEQGFQLFGRAGSQIKRGDSESIQFWNEIPGGFQRRNHIGATERLVSVLKKNSVRKRITRDGNRFLDMIDQGFSYFLQGGDRSTQSELEFPTKS